MRNNDFKAKCAMIISVILMGISFVSIKISVEYIGPISLIYYRFIIASAMLFIMARFSKISLKIKTSDIPKFILSGFIGIIMYFYFQNYALNYITASEASVIVALIPIFSLIVESIITKSKISVFKFILVILSFIGVYIMIALTSSSDIESQASLGYTLMFGAVLSWVFYGITSYPLSIKYPQITVVFYQSVFCSFLLFGLSFFETNSVSKYPQILIYNLIFLGTFCSAITYYLYNYAVRDLGVASTNLYLNLIPIVAVLTSVVFLEESIHLNQIIGGCMVLFSVFSVNLIDKKNIENQIVQSESIVS